MYFALGSADALPARPIIAAMIGDEALVPPTTIQPPWYTATPVAGWATAEMSGAVRVPQCVSCCHDGFAIQPEHPDPAPCQALSVQPRAAVVDFFRVVPPTAMTVDSDAGQLASRKPLSPLDAVMATPAWAKLPLSFWSSLTSSPPQLLDTATAPEPVAASSAWARSVELELLLSTSTMWHSGQTADTMSRSRAISTLQSSSGLNFGSGAVLPFWLSLRKQPFWVVHAGRP